MVIILPSDCGFVQYVLQLTLTKQKDKSFQELSISKRQIYDYQRKIEKIDRENQIQQYIISNLDIAKRNKIDLVYLLEEKQYPIKAICRILNLNTSTFYHDKNRKPAVYLVDEEDDQFKPLIQSCLLYTSDAADE